MPMFEYKCPKCGQRFEKLIARSQADEVQCAACQVQAERQISAFGLGAPSGGDMAYCNTPAAARRDSGGCGSGACGHGH